MRDPMTELEERATQITVLDTGANMGALRIMSKRVEENVARAVLVDLYREGIIAIMQRDWDVARELQLAVKRAVEHRKHE